ncbi:unnamed protein product [Ectocarpus sp. 6 AP-2014]
MLRGESTCHGQRTSESAGETEERDVPTLGLLKASLYVKSLLTGGREKAAGRGMGQQRQYRNHPRGKPRESDATAGIIDEATARGNLAYSLGSKASPAADRNLGQYIAGGCALHCHPSSVVRDERGATNVSLC